MRAHLGCERLTGEASAAAAGGRACGGREPRWTHAILPVADLHYRSIASITSEHCTNCSSISGRLSGLTIRFACAFRVLYIEAAVYRSHEFHYSLAALHHSVLYCRIALCFGSCITLELHFAVVHLSLLLMMMSYPTSPDSLFRHRVINTKVNRRLSCQAEGKGPLDFLCR
jgi:hypothetical protein